MDKRTFLLLTVASITVFGDQLTLKNGDRLTGSITKLDGGKLTFKADMAGDVTIDWPNVAELTTKGNVFVRLKKGQVIEGAIALTPSGIDVTTAQAGHVTATRDDVEFIRAPENYEAEVARYEHPTLWSLWTGAADLGFSLARGNANTATLTTSGTAVRATKEDKIQATFTSIYSSSAPAEGAASVTTANARRGEVTYDRNLSSRTFLFGDLDLEYDQFQGLNFRLAPSAGAGYHLIKNDKTLLDLRAGAALDREWFIKDVTNTYGEAVVAEEFNHKFTAKTTVHEALSFFPNVTSTGNYRMNFDTTAVTAFRKWLGWQFTVSDRLLSNPLPGLKKNDLLLSTGLHFIFGK